MNILTRIRRSRAWRRPRDRRRRGRGELRRDSHPDPAGGIRSWPGSASARAGHSRGVPHVRGAAAAPVRWVVALVGARAYRVDIGGPRVRAASPEVGGLRRRRLHRPVHPSDRGQVGAPIAPPVEARADPHWSLAYFRFWIVKTLVKSNPLVWWPPWCSPLYTWYLRALGAKVGRGTVIFTRHVPVCTDLLDHRPGHGDPQGVVPQLLPGLRGLDPDRPMVTRPVWIQPA